MITAVKASVERTLTAILDHYVYARTLIANWFCKVLADTSDGMQSDNLRNWFSISSIAKMLFWPT